jgi:hypothetical protein
VSPDNIVEELKTKPARLEGDTGFVDRLQRISEEDRQGDSRSACRNPQAGRRLDYAWTPSVTITTLAAGAVFAPD